MLLKGKIPWLIEGQDPKKEAFSNYFFINLKDLLSYKPAVDYKIIEQIICINYPSDNFKKLIRQAWKQHDYLSTCLKDITWILYSWKRNKNL